MKQDRIVLVTTMVDYYGLPQTWPGRANAPSLPFRDRASAVEREVLRDVSSALGSSFDPSRFMPYIVMHEFEGLLFGDPDGFSLGIGKSDLSPKLRAIRNSFGTPEEINDSPDTAPSKRVEDLMPGYQKPLNGVQAAQGIGLEAIRRECPQFSNWLDRLEQRVS